MTVHLAAEIERTVPLRDEPDEDAMWAMLGHIGGTD